MPKHVHTGDCHSDALVLGLGTSGDAAALMLLSEGIRITVVDAESNALLEERADALERAGARVLLNCAGEADSLPGGHDRYDCCVVSPGIPATSPWLLAAQARNVPVVSELELAAQRIDAPLLAVTGTNGKSTLCKLCGDALRAAGKEVVCAGNYGLPLSSVVTTGQSLDWVVVEVSSFQLEHVSHFAPRVGVLLNVQPDHLNRHGSMAAYQALKMRLFERMDAGDTACVPTSLLNQAEDTVRGHPQWTTFGREPSAQWRYHDGCVSRPDRTGIALDLNGTLFCNPVYGVTVAAAAAAISGCGEDPRAVEDAARSFEPLPHRMTEVALKGGVIFIDDSKATNLDALAAAITMCDRPIRLIAGGLLKEKNPERIKEVLENKVRRVYLIGEASVALETAWGARVPCTRCDNLESAVTAAHRDAACGDIVLLSPGCASFDQFRNYADRGETFIEIVEKIRGEE